MSQSELILAAIARQESIISKAEAEIETLKGELELAKREFQGQWQRAFWLQKENQHLKEELDKALPRIPVYFPNSWATGAEVNAFYQDIRLFIPAYAMNLAIAGRWKGFGITMMVDRFIKQYIPVVRASLEKSLCVSVST